MVIIGLLVVAILNLYTTYNKQRVVTVTSNNIAAAQAALQKYQDDNGFYPCPADPSDPLGRATNCAMPAPAGIKVVSGTGGREVRIGAMPIVDMSGETKLISASQAADGWRHRLTYAVTQGMALDATQFVAGQGAIIVKDAESGAVITPSSNIIVLSHGEDGAGAYTAQGGGASRFHCPTDTTDAENCNDDAVFVSGNRSYAFGGLYNDDFVEFTTATAVETTKACPAGSILRGIKSNGDLICTKDLACPAGSAFVGLLSDGETPNCQSVTSSCDATEALVSMTLGAAPVCVRNMPGDCPAGYVQDGTISEAGADFGKPKCLQILTSCPTNYVQVGTNANHTPICVPNLNTRCPANMVQVGNNSDGSASCIAPNCPAGQYLYGINGGSPMCSGDRTVNDGNCPSGQVVIGINGSVITCGIPPSGDNLGDKEIIFTSACNGNQVMGGYILVTFSDIQKYYESTTPSTYYGQVGFARLVPNTNPYTHPLVGIGTSLSYQNYPFPAFSGQKLAIVSGCNAPAGQYDGAGNGQW